MGKCGSGGVFYVLLIVTTDMVIRENSEEKIKMQMLLEGWQMHEWLFCSGELTILHIHVCTRDTKK